MPKRILVVDDNPAIRGALRRILEFNDEWKVCGEAVDGRDGIEKARELRPDLVVLDLSMPVMNGLETSRVLRESMPDLPVILCSLHSDELLQREASAAGVTAVVSKAHNMESLIQKARELLAS